MGLPFIRNVGHIMHSSVQSFPNDKATVKILPLTALLRQVLQVRKAQEQVGSTR